MSTRTAGNRIEAVRRFNRFYTRQIGLLLERYLRSPFSLAEARVLYELAHHEQTTATELSSELTLDPGYVSRILRGFGKRGLVVSSPFETDGRKRCLRLSKKGQGSFAMINTRSQREIRATLARLPVRAQERLIQAMQTVEELLGAEPQHPAPYILRLHRPGDMGWVVQCHGALYAEEYGWDVQFEAFVAEIVSRFIRNFDPEKERCWIAEKDGENVGSVFLVRKSTSVAKLRLLIVEPEARGLGIGARLVDECITFARQAGYRTITLWTNSILSAARHIYKKAGFRRIMKERHKSFGHDLVAETWELNL
ncbi:MAG: GNAT family N-acetyltransferase [Hyphomicrobiales bacterium]